MRKLFLNIILIVLGLHTAQAQYTYFNQIEGEIGDLASETMSNIEVVDDGYITWGGGINNGVDLEYMRKFDLNGVLVDENILDLGDESFYAGIVNSMQWNPYTEQFVVLQGSIIGDGLSARLLSFDTDLELDQNMVFDTYSPNTYFYGFLIEEDGYVIYGEQGALSNSEATFIMKMDFEGNVLWNEILQVEVYQDIYRNTTIAKTENQYLIFGGGYDDEYFGLITVTDLQGNTVSEIEVVDEDALRSNYLGCTQLENGEYLFVQPIGYELVEEIGNPNVFWNKFSLSKFNPETEEITLVQEYFTDNECFRCGPFDLEATPDGGLVILGGRAGWFYDNYAWMMKVDADGNQEWFKEYTYESCDDCDNVLYDIELAPDGGYIAAGKFHNSDIDPRNSPWLLKVDACGDVEWQDCPISSVGLVERNPQSFSIYPNSSAGRFTVSTDTQKRVVGVEVVDMTGISTPLDGLGSAVNVTASSSFEINIDVPTGLYLLRLELEDGSVESYRVEVVR